MKRVLRLSLAFLREHPFRVLVTSLATMAACATVVWTSSSYDALLNSFEEYSDKSQGRYTLSVAPISTFRQYAPGDIPATAQKFVPPEVTAELRTDPAVLAADNFWVQRVQARPIRLAAPAAPDKPPAPDTPRPYAPDVRLIGTDAPQPPYPLTEGHWIDPARHDLPEAVLSAHVATQLNLRVGDELLTGEGTRARRLRIIGLVANPSIEGFNAGVATAQIMTPALGGLYVPTPLAEEIVGQPARIHFVGILVDPAADLTAFRYVWTPRLGNATTPVQFQEAGEVAENLDQGATAENVRMQAYNATAIATLAALFLVFSTLNIGVAERIRQFAILRAIAFTRFQIGALIAVESIIFATIGLVGGVGIGAAIVRAVVRATAHLFRSNTASVGMHSIALAAICMYGGACLAAIFPILRATRVRPMDAMTPHATTPTPRLSAGRVALGLLLLTVQPLITFALPLPDAIRHRLHMAVGYPSIALAFIFLAPACVVLVDRLMSPLLARLLGLPPRLLASQITAHLWRTSGIALALSIGLGLYVTIQVWGYSMLDSFVPGSWAPSALVAFPDGVEPAAVAQIAQQPGVIADHCLPVVFEQPRLREDLTRSAERATVTRQDTVVIVGLDPARAFGGDNPLFQFTWADGSPAQAVPLLQSGRGCIVPDHFLTQAGLKVGDSFDLVPPENPAQPVTYTIAGAVHLPGWHWQTKQVGFRSRTHRACALVFASYDNVARDFSRPIASHIWLDFDPALTTAEQLAQNIRAIVPPPEAPATPGAPDIRVIPVTTIRQMVRGHATRLLWSMSHLPLITLAITCLGVLNALLASVRARRWDIGILRAIGFTRWAIVRAVIAEGLLIGIVAAGLSLAFGILAGWCGTGISQYVSFFAGMPPAFILAWGPISFGLISAILMCAIAAIGPAITMARTQPLTLLQQGRGSF